MPGKFFSIAPLPCLVLLLALSAVSNVVAQPQGATAMAAVSEEMLRSKIDALNSSQQLDAALKAKLLETYQSALAQLQAAEAYQAQTEAYEHALKAAPAELKSVKKTIDKAAGALKTIRPETFEDVPTDELEQSLAIERGKLSDVNNQLKKLETDVSVQSGRVPQIRMETTALQDKLDAATNSLKAPRGGEQKLESEARDLLLQTQQIAFMAELKMLQLEQLSNTPRVELLKAQIELLTQQSNALLPGIEMLEEMLSERRREEADKVRQELSQAEKELAGKPPVIQTITRENIEYGQKLSSIAGKIAQRTAEQEQINTVNSRIDKDFKSAEQKINLAGLSPALGKILREQRRNLPNSRQLEAQSQELQNETATVSFEQYNVEDQLNQLSDINQVLKNLMNEQVDASLPADERLRIQVELRMLLNNQKELLSKLQPSYQAYLRLIGDLEFARRQTVVLAEKYALYLDKRLLWVPSSAPINGVFFKDLYHGLAWILNPRPWLQAARELGRELVMHPLTGVFSIVGLAGLFALKRQAIAKLLLISKKVSKQYSDKFVYTLQTLAYNLVLVAPLPLSFFFAGQLLRHDLSMSEFTHAAGEGFCAASVPLFSVQFLYVLTHPQGLAALQLGWRTSSTTKLRRLLGWFRFVLVPAIFLIAMTGAQSNAGYGDGLGRLALILLLLAGSLVIATLLKFKGGVLETFFYDNPHSWVTRLRYLWYPGLIAMPLVVSLFAMAGYYASALELEHKLIISTRLIIVALVTRDLAVRWLSLVNRKLAIIKARQKREADQAAKSAAEAVEDTQVFPVQEEIDIPTINAQTRQMLKVLIVFGLVISLWLVWADILPALAILENIVLWRHAVNIDGVESLQPITMINLMLAGFYAFIVIMAIRNLPGVLEIVMLKQLAVEPGNRYAVNQLARYVLIAAGAISIANELGGSWEKIQWLVAALGVGLGFGLQEIFANLVSGIILLFERPMRVGDTVTVGDLSGKVCRIQMRATTIVDWDQKELIVPNKTFITSQLVNWTLSDQVTRLVIDVGVAYGSDTELVHKVLYEAVRAAPLALKDPEPSIYFVGFGDSALKYTIRVFVNELGNRLPLTHDLHMRIERALREHHIEIPFTQRDIHIRSIASSKATHKE